MVYFGIETATLSFDSTVAGSIGLVTYNTPSNTNFLSQMKSQGLIDHEIIAFYTPKSNIV